MDENLFINRQVLCQKIKLGFVKSRPNHSQMKIKEWLCSLQT